MAQVTQLGKEAHVAQEEEEKEGGEEEEELLFPNHNKNTEKSLTELPLPASSGALWSS